MNRRKINKKLLDMKKKADLYGIRIPEMPLLDESPWLRKTTRQIKKRFTAKPPYCSAPWKMLLITCDGEVIPCFGWNPEIKIGSIADKSFKEIWESKPYSELRHELWGKGKIQKSCRRCPNLSLCLTPEAQFLKRNFDLALMKSTRKIV